MSWIVSIAILTLAIIFVAAIRKLAINNIPKFVFVAVWVILGIRLVMPFAAPVHMPFINDMANARFISLWSQEVDISPYTSTFRGLTAAYTSSPAAGKIADIILPQLSEDVGNIAPLPSTAESGLYLYGHALSEYVTHHTQESALTINIRYIFFAIWLVGMLVFALYFIINHYRFRQEMRDSTPIECDILPRQLWKSHIPAVSTLCPTLRNVQIRHSHKISSPVTYGLFRPVILMPSTTNWRDEKQLNYVLAHEYVHIHRYDCVWKALFAVVLCIHWFNPFVWVMFFLANRDIELSCDEAVIKLFKHSPRTAYALVLLDMAESSSQLAIQYNGFSKFAIEERIHAMIANKKKSALATILMVGLVTVMAACSAIYPTQDGYTDAQCNTAQMMTQALHIPDAAQSNNRNITVSHTQDPRLVGCLAYAAMPLHEAADIGVAAIEKLYGVYLDGAYVSGFYTTRQEFSAGVYDSGISQGAPSRHHYYSEVLTQFLINNDLTTRGDWYDHIFQTQYYADIFSSGSINVANEIPAFWTGMFVHEGYRYTFLVYSETGAIREITKVAWHNNSIVNVGRTLSSLFNYGSPSRQSTRWWAQNKHYGVDIPLYAMHVIEMMGIFEGEVTRARISGYSMSNDHQTTYMASINIMPGDYAVNLHIQPDASISPIAFVCVESKHGEYAQLVITGFLEDGLHVARLSTVRSSVYRSWLLQYDGTWAPVTTFDWVSP
ncbi:MAG: M56 family metallopeptidase [Defluviitaleaceae bacterium]|nr:M56 family metallopeptidase [Defluviitaleaceae bacterium]